jgi:hypothetical protein
MTKACPLLGESLTIPVASRSFSLLLLLLFERCNCSLLLLPGVVLLPLMVMRIIIYVDNCYLNVGVVVH